METTTVNIPNNLLPLWKGIEGLDDEGRKAILVIVSGMSKNYEHKKSEKMKTSDDKHPNPKRLFLTPEIRALEKGFKVSDDLSDDYKKELRDIRAKRYL